MQVGGNEQFFISESVVTDRIVDYVDLGRRAFLWQGSLVMTAASTHSIDWRCGWKMSSPLRFGIVTDMHFADNPPAGTRHYRESLTKLAAAAKYFSEQQIDFVVELGDFIDAADSVDVEMSYLQTINKQFAKICDERHYVLGNHCVDTLTKQEFLDGVTQQESFYSFDRKGVHLVVLDACFRSDGEPYQRKNFQWTDANISESELEWLADDLASNNKPTIVFAHQRLDVASQYGVKNNTKVRQILESSGHVLAVFQGHSHKNELKNIAGIHYCTLVAMVEGAGLESNGFSVVEIQPDGTIVVTGAKKQKSYSWKPL